MSSSFFTRPSLRHTVPHGRIGERLVLVAHLAITRAFELIREEKLPLASASENEITIKLENVLDNQVLNQGEVEGFDKNFFGKVRRVEVVNFDGSKQSKKPDLCFDLQRENRIDWDQLQDALFAECKPVDKNHPLNGHYCAVNKDCSGIERFVIGDYAWAMEEALMIGYVRNGITIHPHLANSLKDKTRRSKLGNPTPLVSINESTCGDISSVLYRTTHQRSFIWTNNDQQATPIDLFHSWHDCG